MGGIVIVAYKPKEGMETALLAAVEKHLRVLHAQQLVTDRPAHIMCAADGTIVEVFEWRSAEAIHNAHANAAVQALWGEFAACSDYVPLAALDEAQQIFADFDPLSI